MAACAESVGWDFGGSGPEADADAEEGAEGLEGAAASALGNKPPATFPALSFFGPYGTGLASAT